MGALLDFWRYTCVIRNRWSSIFFRMTKLLTDDGTLEKFRWMCFFVFDSCTDERPVSAKEIEQLLEFLCDLEGSEYVSFGVILIYCRNAYCFESEVSNKLKTTLLCATSGLLIRNVSGLLQFAGKTFSRTYTYEHKSSWNINGSSTRYAFVRRKQG